MKFIKIKVITVKNNNENESDGLCKIVVLDLENMGKATNIRRKRNRERF